MTLGIWRLAYKPFEEEGGHAWEQVHVVVVIAATEEAARKLASQCLDEPTYVSKPTEFLDEAQTRCEYLGLALPDAEERLICVDYDRTSSSPNYPPVKGTRHDT